MKNWFGAIALILACGTVHAQAPSLRFHGHLGYSAGGATLVSGTYTDGTSYTINAGQGLMLALGADYRVAEQVSVQATVGSHVDKTHATNGEIAFRRTPVELLVFYDLNEQLRLGGGLRKAQNAEVTASGVAAGMPGTGSYESSGGLVFEGQYFFASTRTTVRKAQWGLGVRIVSESYKPNDGSTGARDGSHLGVSLLFYY